jgi:AcrR family transcriptional regulator
MTEQVPTVQPGVARPLRADAQRNRDRLVEAARRTFQRCGAEATLEAVAKEAGVGIGTLYRHFPTRLDLVEAVYRSDVETLVAAAAASLDQPADQALAEWLDRFLEYGLTKRALFHELAEAFGRESELLSYCGEQMRTAAARVIDRAKAEGVIRSDVSPADVLRLVHGLIMAPNPDREQIRRLAGVILDGLRVTRS